MIRTRARRYKHRRKAIIVGMVLMASLLTTGPVSAAKPNPTTGENCATVTAKSATESLKIKVKADHRCDTEVIRLLATAQVNGSIVPLQGPSGGPYVEVTPGKPLKVDWDLSRFFACDGSDYRFTVDAWVMYGDDIIATFSDDTLKIKC